MSIPSSVTDIQEEAGWDYDSLLYHIFTYLEERGLLRDMKRFLRQKKREEEEMAHFYEE
jgi:hypothetical protein